MATIHIPLDRAANTPVFRQIYDALRTAILDGRLAPGQRIPSTRALAADIGVSRLPVLTAFEQLLHEGYLVGRKGSGTFVTERIPDHLLRPRGASRPAPRKAPRRETAPAAATTAQITWDFPLVPFQLGVPALDRFPHALWSRLLARHVRNETPDSWTYGDPAGERALRIAIADHLRTSRAVRCDADQILIVPGSQAALRIAASVVLADGARVAIEEPGYFGAHRALRAAGATLVPVRVDDEGLDVGALRKHGPDVRAVYVTPSHQYPLGVTMSASRRVALLDWAVRQKAWILEDDYDSEFRYVSRPIGALQGMDDHDRVIYIGTFSKAIFPALRVGYVVVPRALWTPFVETRFAFDIFMPTLYQHALAAFLRDGHFARHLRRMRGVYLERREALLQGIERHAAGLVPAYNADAGLHAALLLRAGLDDQLVLAELAKRGVAAHALSPSYIGSAPRQGLLLGFGCASPAAITTATKVLGEVLKRVSRGTLQA